MKKFLSALFVGLGWVIVSAVPGQADERADAARVADQIAQAAKKDNFDAAKYFHGKNIRVIVGFAAGGGTDLQARHFATHWSDYIPGKPRFTVVNITPNLSAANRLAASPPDGLTLEMTAGSDIIAQFEDAQAKYKAEENRVIGTHNGSSSTLFARKDFPYRTMADAINGTTPLRIGARGPTDAYVMRMAALSEWLHIPMKFISGLSGTAENLIALERGDTDGYIPGGGGGVWYSLPTIRPGWLKDGTIRVFAITGPEDIKIGPNRELEAPDAPYAGELIKDPEHKKLYDIMTRADTLYGKIWIAPPKTPDNVINVLRASYEALLEDKVFAQKLEEMMGEPIHLTRGEEVEKEMKSIVKGYAENAEKFKQWQTWAQERF
jgi:tripartite-type tricarboxylate transporter receptor subunit TctC